MTEFLDVLKQRVLVYDGAMGTNLQKFNLQLDDFWGHEGCNEILVLSRPDAIRGVHEAFLQAGCDVIETDTFGSTRIVLAEYDLQDRVRELNLAAVKIAREAADAYSTPEKPRFISGSMGPTTKLPSLGHIGYDEMYAAFLEQAEALIEGGVDVLLVETCQDLLQAKIALAACREALHAAELSGSLTKKIALQVQVTLEASGTMLLGSDISAAVAVLESFRPDIIGLNCATGPVEMNDAVRFLCQNSTAAISVLPNAGLPHNEGGCAVYKLAPAELAEHHRRFVTEYGVQLVGGCCGTTPDHLRAVAEAVRDAKPAARDLTPRSVVASAFSAVPLEAEAQPIVIAEEMNTTTRMSHFRDMVKAADYDGILTMAKRLVSEGSQLLDVCCAIVGEDEKAYMSAVLDKLATRIPAPIVIDSTEPDVIEEALKRVPGKPVINSINLEDGEKRAIQVLAMARRYGAAVVALTIDEDGMALTADKKVSIAHRIYKLAVEQNGLRPEDLIFDALTLPISTGQEDYRSAGIETLEAVRRIKLELPGVRTTLGVSNISFGLKAYPRRVLNSVFLKEAADRGLDTAIINYAKIYPLYKIPAVEVELARKLIFQEGAEGTSEPLQNYLAHFAGLDKGHEEEQEIELETLPLDEKLKQMIIRGERVIGHGDHKQTLEEALEEALQTHTPLELINTVLLDGMKTVGELFGARKMQLPSVLDSAAVMKSAVAHLEPKMERSAGDAKGTMVLATVKGDVHDIGKNLVEIILSNNGFRVINLGIKQPSDVILNAAREHNADAIGLSGLLVKSTLEMKYIVQDLQRLGLKIPVICGGAALTRKYVEDDLRKEYAGPVYYAEDAFAGLHVMADLTHTDPAVRLACITDGATPRSNQYGKSGLDGLESMELTAEGRSPVVATAEKIPTPAFWGARTFIDYSLDEVFPYINETTLFKHQWQLKHASADEYTKIVEEKYRPILEELKAEVRAAGWFQPKSVVGFYPCSSQGDELVVFDPNDHAKELERIRFPRQSTGRRLCIADYFEPLSSGRRDVVGFQIVTVGEEASRQTQKLYDAGDYTRYLYLHGLSVETAEALAELVHMRSRAFLGIDGSDGSSVKELIHQTYQGSRYSYGYPACPNLEDQQSIFRLLEPEKNIGVRLTESFLLEPEQSTNAILVHHPKAKYFVV